MICCFSLGRKELKKWSPTPKILVSRSCMVFGFCSSLPSVFLYLVDTLVILFSMKVKDSYHVHSCIYTQNIFNKNNKQIRKQNQNDYNSSGYKKYIIKYSCSSNMQIRYIVLIYLSAL